MCRCVCRHTHTCTHVGTLSRGLDVIPQVPPSSAELVPAGLSVLGYFGVCVGKRVCQGLYTPGERESPCVLWMGGVSSSTRGFLNPQALGSGGGDGSEGWWCSLGPSAHLAEAWASAGYSATLWGCWEGSVASPGNRWPPRRETVTGKSDLGDLEGQTTPRASLSRYICVVPVSWQGKR